MRPFKMRPGKAEELHDIVLFALRSGLRKGEIGALRPRDVNFEKNVIVVRRSYSEKEKVVKQTTKSKNYRFVEMNGDMREILKKRIAPHKICQIMLLGGGASYRPIQRTAENGRKSSSF